VPKPGNWNRDPWNRGKARVTGNPSRLGTIMNVIIRERVKQQCSQEWLAERTGWSQGAISRYERGEDRIPLAYVEAAASALDLVVTIKHKGDE